MRILNLSGEALPALQGVGEAPHAMRKLCLEALADGNPAGVRAGRIRGAVQTAAWQAHYAGDTSLVEAINAEEPWLVVLPKGEADVAREFCLMQIGPEPGTSIPLIVPVEARNRQWSFAGSASDLRLPIVFEVDQYGDVTGMANFVHRTPPVTGAQIDPRG